MSRVTKTVCDRCGEEIIYRGWTAKFPFARKRPFLLKLLKLRNGNPSGYDYSEREYELCNKCTCKDCEYFCPLENEPKRGVCSHPERNDKMLVYYFGSLKSGDYCTKFTQRETKTRRKK